MSADFWADGYSIAPELIDADQLKLLRAGMDVSARKGQLRIANNGVQQGSHNEYKPLPGELVMRQVMPRLEEIVGRPLAPTYSFWRIYEKGMNLKPHRDRNACEISVSVTIHAEPADTMWPLFLTDLSGQDHAPPLHPGDGLLYQGCAIKHWREPFAGARQYQLFLHYVIADGEKAELTFDSAVA
jgi:hypothetical protein